MPSFPQFDTTSPTTSHPTGDFIHSIASLPHERHVSFDQPHNASSSKQLYFTPEVLQSHPSLSQPSLPPGATSPSGSSVNVTVRVKHHGGLAGSIRSGDEGSHSLRFSISHPANSHHNNPHNTTSEPPSLPVSHHHRRVLSIQSGETGSSTASGTRRREKKKKTFTWDWRQGEVDVDEDE
ncbi:hypothetical protein AGDE_16605 [Angomonas deanei]|uniref:Uncharacterized protein n=1 Tax=Angomonas deanei TaxID=59799 RepID=A0A7G2C2U7_9TRYP|nr:hypothetical protein AGDE_16605 [Angomonas deanei]CAD2213835.1 hypothetical protein, conserved [Angomonas deanei]|eukprot:EPY16792.1 hypothetical protein AGDE_16605 [Angomonas deanei]